MSPFQILGGNVDTPLWKTDECRMWSREDRCSNHTWKSTVWVTLIYIAFKIWQHMFLKDQYYIYSKSFLTSLRCNTIIRKGRSRALMMFCTALLLHLPILISRSCLNTDLNPEKILCQQGNRSLRIRGTTIQEFYLFDSIPNLWIYFSRTY